MPDSQESIPSNQVMSATPQNLDSFHYNPMPGPGSYTPRQQNLRNLVYNTLTHIPTQNWVTVGPTGYWNSSNQISDRWGYSTDSLGRLIFILDNIIVMQRYLNHGPYIYYSLYGTWKHEVADATKEQEWCDLLASH